MPAKNATPNRKTTTKEKLMNEATKQKLVTGLTVVGAVTVAYFGLRTAAVALDPKVHTATRNAVKAVATAAKKAADNGSK